MNRPRTFALVTAALAALTACDGLKDAMSAHADTVATAGSQELSVDHFAQLLGRSQVPLQREVAKNLAGLWIDYQLLGEAAAKGDSMADPKVVDDAMWAVIATERVRKLGEQVLSRASGAPDTANAAQRYASGELLAAKHILVPFGGQPGAPVSAAVRDSVRRKAEAIRAQTTVANFSQVARQNSGDPGSAAQGGLLGVFPKGAMVPQFERALVALQPGQLSGLVETPFGYHVLYRPTYAEVSQQFGQALGQRTRQVAESTYIFNLETSAKIDVKADAPLWTKSVAADVNGHLKDSKVLATSTAGDLTAGRVANWVAALPEGTQLRGQIQQAPDSIVKTFVRRLARNEVLLKQADSAKIALTPDELGNLRRAFVNAVTSIFTGLGVAPAQLADSAKTEAAREVLAAKRVESYLDRLVQQRAQFIEVPTPIEAAVRAKYDWKLNDAGLDRALEKAATVRASADSARSAGQPATAVPLPGQGGAPAPAPTPPPAGQP